MVFRFLTFCLACLAFSGLVLPAESARAEVPSVSAELEAPQAKFIQHLGNQAIKILSDKTIPKEERDTRFRNMLHEAFDLPTIARFVIGRSWLAATPEQKKVYMDLFEKLVIKTYSDRFALYTGEGFKVTAVHPEEGTRDSVVNSEITHPDGSAPTTVDWRVRTKADKMGIIDVVVEGVSMSVTQRQEYSSVIQRNGGSIEALLDMMRSRLAQQTAAAPAK